MQVSIKYLADCGYSFNIYSHPTDLRMNRNRRNRNRRSFAPQKAAFHRVKGYLLQPKRQPFANRLIVSVLQACRAPLGKKVVDGLAVSFFYAIFVRQHQYKQHHGKRQQARQKAERSRRQYDYRPQLGRGLRHNIRQLARVDVSLGIGLLAPSFFKKKDNDGGEA